MKRIISVCCFCLLVFFLTGCNSKELEEQRLEIVEKNVNTEQVNEIFNKNLNVVEEFNIIFDSGFFNNSEESLEKLDDYLDYNRSLKETVIYLKEMLNSDNVSIKYYPFLVEETGDICEYIILNSSKDSVFLILNWKDSKIVFYSFE